MLVGEASAARSKVGNGKGVNVGNAVGLGTSVGVEVGIAAAVIVTIVHASAIAVPETSSGDNVGVPCGPHAANNTASVSKRGVNFLNMILSILILLYFDLIKTPFL